MVAAISKTFIDYFLQVVGIDVTNIQLFFGAIVLITLMFIWNCISTMIGAMISSTATVIKVIPLIIIVVIGVIYVDWSNITATTRPILETRINSGNIYLFLDH